MTLEGPGRVTSGLVTVVFVDVAGSTALVDRLGDDAGTAAVQAQLCAVRERIEPYDGHEVKSLGDGVMLTFQSPRMAVSFALAAQRALGESVPRIRIGINTGEVIDAEGDPLGGAVNAAARIADKAKGGEVLVSEVVRQLAGSVPAIQFVDRGRTRLKGFPDRWRLYAAIDHITKALAPTTIGRADELALIDRLLSAAEAGSGQLLVLEGEAGIGKTHLMRAAIDAARARKMRIIEGATDELDTRPGAIVRSLIESITSEFAARHRLAELFTAPTFGGDGLDLGYAVVEATVDLVETLAAAGPVVVAVEDLHWADELSLRAVAAIARRAGPSAIVLLATCRPAPRPPLLDRLLELVHTQHGRHLHVQALDDVSVCALASAHTGAAPGDRLLDRLATASGNPLFVTELLRSYEEDGALAVEGGTVQVSDDRLPADLRETIVRRLSWLSTTTVELLRLGSILGGSFTLRDLAAVSGRSVVDVASGLHEAAQAAIVAGDGDRLNFRHDLIREAIYEDMVPAVRRDLHRAAGQVLAANEAPVMQVAQQLALGSRVGDLDAVEWLERAAVEALAYDPVSAIQLLEQAVALAPVDWPGRAALEILMIVPMSACGRSLEAEDVVKRVLAGRLEPDIEYVARSGLAAVHGNRGNLPAAIAAIHAATAVPGAPTVEALRLRCVGAAMSILSGVDVDSEAEVARAALAESELNGDHTLTCIALQVVGIAASVRGHDDEALTHINAAVELFESGLVPWQSYLTPHAFRGILFLELDRPDDALRSIAEARRRAEVTGATASLPLALLGESGAKFVVGNWDDAVTDIESALTIADDIGFPLFTLWNFAILARIAMHRGDLATADEWLARGGEHLATGGQLIGADWLFGTQALLLETRGQPEAALNLLEAIWMQTAPVRYMFGHRWLATHTTRLAVACGRDDLALEVTLAMEEGARRGSAVSAAATAKQCRGLLTRDADILVEAVAARRSVPFVPELAQCCEQAAVVLAESDRRDEAVKLLDEAAALHVGLGATGDLARVDALLRGLGARRRRQQAERPTTGWESLTRMERQVADLVAEGLTNPAIGARLFVSRRTVETHLSHIFTKCGLTSRTQVAAEVVRHDPQEPAEVGP